ncbi:hypothetical protein [Paraburkholderia agricolaris]|uniref:hypothetical protein n=1 Tax=Paraburkholderia agricolaris TaxID=2152888 RepID=UPI0012928D2E|nr:hypothetical protein [Paraburkholderia agricolaris]
MHQRTSTTTAQQREDSVYLPTSPEFPDYIFASDAVYFERTSHPKRSKNKLPEIPAGYSASFTLDPRTPVFPATPDGNRLGDARALRALPAGVVVLCPKPHRGARQRVGYTVGREGGLAEGILCPLCKHIYYFLTLAPSPSPAFSNIGEYYEDIRRQLGY